VDGLSGRDRRHEPFDGEDNMVDRDHRIPSDAVVQESSHTAGGKVSEDGGTTTVMWKKNHPWMV